MLIFISFLFSANAKQPRNTYYNYYYYDTYQNPPEYTYRADNYENYESVKNKKLDRAYEQGYKDGFNRGYKHGRSDEYYRDYRKSEQTNNRYNYRDPNFATSNNDSFYLGR